MKKGSVLNLVVATITFAATYWAWNLIGPLGPRYQELLHLSPIQVSVLVSTPVLVGAFGRIPVGVLTDRYGGRLVMTGITFISIIPVLMVGFSTTYVTLLAGAFALGLVGTAIVVSIAHANSWFDKSKRGLATGIVGMGMGGSSISAVATPHLVDAFGIRTTHVIMAGVLAVMGVAVWLLARDVPGWAPVRTPVLPALKDAARVAETWRQSALYALSGGGYIAFAAYMPTLLINTYDEYTTIADVGLRTAGFAAVAVVSRTFGGWLSDRIGPKLVLVGSYAATGLLALIIVFSPRGELAIGATYLSLAVAFGIAMGGNFAMLAKVVEPSKMGAAGGIVSLVGGLGGFFPPLVMGAIYQAWGSYTLGLGMLAAAAFACFAYIVVAYRDQQNTDGGVRSEIAPQPVTVKG